MTAGPRFRLAFALSALVLTACTTVQSTTSTTIFTGVIVRADSLLGQRQCGTQVDQVFKYGATIVNADGVPLSSGLYDCFADAVFVNLPPADSGRLDFSVLVSAFNAVTFDEENARLGLDQAGLSPARLAAANPTWITRCRATQQQDIQVLAVCDPLAEGPPGAVVNRPVDASAR